KDTAKKEELLRERRALEVEFDTLTKAWMKTPGGKISEERDALAKKLREQYSRLSPYTRAVSLYERWGVAVNGQVNWTYNIKGQ
ncbi:hypothetical protein BGZ76_001827, partial [Entomortierella beljakovae]